MTCYPDSFVKSVPLNEMHGCQLSTINGRLHCPLPSSPCRKKGIQNLWSWPSAYIGCLSLKERYCFQKLDKIDCHPATSSFEWPPNNMDGASFQRAFTHALIGSTGHQTASVRYTGRLTATVTGATSTSTGNSALFRRRRLWRFRHTFRLLFPVFEIIFKRSCFQPYWCEVMQ